MYSNNNELEKLKYLQEKVHKILLECINTYSLVYKQKSLFYSFSGSAFMRFRNSVDIDISNPTRLKANSSVINNIEKEILKKLNNNLPDNYGFEDIDKLVPKVVKAVCKDYLGATIIFYSKNNCSKYCKESDNKYIKTLYKATLTTEEYLRSSDHLSKENIFSKLYGKIKKIDISDTFIDENPNPNAPRKVRPLDLNNINSLEKYLNTKIELLTLLTNSSIPCTESTDNKKHKYCVSELDIPYLQLVKQVMAKNPSNKDVAIELLIDLAHENYFREYLPFDEQLEKALKIKSNIEYNPAYTAPFSDEAKEKYTQELINLKNNLVQLKNDRLLNYILTLELPNIFNELSEQSNLDVKIKSHKERAKSSGFYSTYYTVELNNMITCEVLGCSEFRHNLSQEGYASHNTMYKKSFNIKPLFELRNCPFPNSKHAKSQLDFYCEFLSTVNFNDVNGYHIPKEDTDALNYLKNLVNYATSKIKVKDYIAITNGNHTFKVNIFDHITNILEYNGAKFVTIYPPAHSIEHNQSIAHPHGPLHSLEALLKSRIGLSALANMVREKYVEIATLEKHDKLLANSLGNTYSSTLTPKYYFPLDYQTAKEAKENFEPLDIKFHPMGHYRDEDDGR